MKIKEMGTIWSYKFFDVTKIVLLWPGCESEQRDGNPMARPNYSIAMCGDWLQCSTS